MNDNKNFRRPIKRHTDPYRGAEDTTPDERDEIAAGVIEGRNAVIEAMRAGRPIDKVYIAKHNRIGLQG